MISRRPATAQYKMMTEGFEGDTSDAARVSAYDKGAGRVGAIVGAPIREGSADSGVRGGSRSISAVWLNKG